jgi:hypothetical protein
MSKQFGTLATLGLSILLTACGGNNGGGGGVASNAADSANGGGSSNLAGGGSSGGNANAEGVWHSQQANGDVLDVVILEDGSLYGLTVGTNLSAPLLALDQGGYTVSGDKLSAQVTHYNHLQTTVQGTVGATVATGFHHWHHVHHRQHHHQFLCRQAGFWRRQQLQLQQRGFAQHHRGRLALGRSAGASDADQLQH